MATISISQLDTATQAKVDDLYEVAVVDANSQTGYASRKLTAAQIATLIAQGVQFSGLSTEAKTIIAAINEAAQNGGTEVEANPAGTPTDTLETIGIDGTIYEVGGSSEPVSKTATGNPISITDAADAPIVSGEVTFEPKQDLHGYEKPWVGGAGKNKLPMTVGGIKALNTSGTWSGNVYSLNGVTFEILVDSDNNVTGIKANGTATSQANFFIDNNFNGVGSSTIISGCPQNGGENKYKINVEKGTSPWTVYASDTGNGALINGHVTGESVLTYIIIYNAYAIPQDGMIFYPMIRIATETDPTFEPYSNICPIEGYTDCELEVTGKNLFDTTIQSQTQNGVTITVNSDKTISVSGTPTGLYVFDVGIAKVKSYFGNVTISGISHANNISWNTIQLFDKDNNFLATIADNSTIPIITFDLTNYPSADYIRIGIKRSSDNPVSGYLDVQIELGTEATPYEPYQSTTYTIDLDGTRYGGKIAPVTGKMSDGMGHIASYAGETIGEPWLSDRDDYVAGTTPTTGAEVVYTLASPTIVQLTPQQIRTLEGTNNISTNMTDMSLEYITQDYQPLVKLIERSAGHHYSTQERVVGTWIDGKPLYEQTFNVSPLIANDTWQEIANVGLKLLINFECISYNSTESGKETSFDKGKQTPQIKGNSSSGKLFYALVAGSPVNGLYVTARYTKITD